MFALDAHRFAHRVRLPVDPPLLLLLAARAQILIQRGQIFYFRHRHQMVPPEIAHFAFHAALLVAARRVAKLRLESPVRTKSDQPVGLLALVPAQNLLHRALQVVVAQPPEHSAEIVKGPLVRFQKRLLRGVKIRSMKRSAARHAAHREKMCGLAALLELHRGLVPIHLGLHAPVVTLRHERLARRHPQLLLSPPHVAPHRRFRHAHLGMLLANPFPDAVRRVPLLARRFPIALQNPVDELAHRPQLRTAPRRCLALRRHRAGQRLPHHPPMRVQLLRHSLDRAHSKPVLPTYLLEQFHFASPVHRPPVVPADRLGRSSCTGWAKSNARSGPIQSSEIERRKRRAAETRPRVRIISHIGSGGRKGVCCRWVLRNESNRPRLVAVWI